MSSPSIWNNSEGASTDIPAALTPLNDDSQNDENDEVSAWQDFIAGGLAGSASVVVGHPFDTMKVSPEALWFH